MREFLNVDPAALHVPPSRASGAAPARLQRQIARYGDSLAGMPPPLVYRGDDDALMIYDGATRATRAAKFQPGVAITVEVVGELAAPCGHLPTVGGKLP
jgi:hypothetical protein